MSGLPATPNSCDDAGRKVGMWTEADSHGGFMTGEYVNGERHGHWRHLAKDGRLRSEDPYAHGQLNGEWTSFNPDGSVKSVKVYR